MSDLRDLRPQSGASVGTIVHAGPGAETALADYLATDCKRVVVIEPDEQAAASLRSGAGSDVRVQVINAILHTMPGKATVIRFNFAELDSVAEPSGLKKLFPGLRETGRETVPAITPAELMQQIKMSESAQNWLILETPGQELSLLGAMSKDGSLRSFATVLVRTSEEVLYQGGSDLTSLEAWLHTQGFTQNRTLGGEDPSRPWLRLSYDAARDVQAQAAKKVKAAQEQANAQIAALESALAKAQDELVAKQSDSKTARRQAGTAKAQMTRLRNQSEAAKAQIADLTEQNADLTAELEALRAQINDLQSQLGAASKDAAEAKAVLQKANAELTEQTQRSAALDQKLSEQSASHADAQEQITTLTAQRDEALQEIVKVREALDNRRARVANVEKELDAQQGALEAEQQKIAVLVQERDDAAQETIKVRAALETTRAKVTQLESAATSAATAAEAKQAALRAECDALNDKLMRSRHELLKLEGQIEVIRGLFLQQVPSV